MRPSFASGRWVDLLVQLERRCYKRVQGEKGLSAKHLQRVRRICGALPEASERLSHGEPTFFVRKKVFAMFSNNHHKDGHIAVVVPAPTGVQEMLIEASPEKYYRPPYVGVRGWIGVELGRVSDEELAFHLHEAWRLIAPKKLRFESDASPEKEEAVAKKRRES